MKQTKASMTGKLLEGAVPVELLSYYESILNHLITSLENPADPRAVLAVTGYYRGEGTSTVSANLAAALAQLTGQRVLLVDTNLTDPSIHRFFGMEQGPGLTDLIQSGSADVSFSKQSPFGNLDILAAGQGSANLSALFESHLLPKLMEVWRREYSFVVFDWPALNETTTGMRMANVLTGVVLVVEAERTRWEVALRPRNILVQGRFQWYGAVLNKRRFYIPGWLYRTI
jgi:capsular exopolysaccharide synthesis family protein